MSKIIPQLQINKMIVLGEGKEVYNQQFNPGINILAGDNGVGKSTIMDLLFYSLGGEVKNWVKEVNSCDFVATEIIVNKTTITLMREINAETENPMNIFEGNIEQAFIQRKKWLTFPYKRSSNKKSFSQILFNYLNYPESKTEENSSLTINQLLRLIYTDQHSTPSRLMKEDSEFDRPSLRLAIGEFLLGIDDLEVHILRQKIIQLNQTISSQNGEIKSIIKFLDDNSSAKEIEEILIQNKDIEKEINSIEKYVFEISHKSENNADEIIKNIQSSIENLSSELQELIENKNYIYLDIEDSKLFIKSLNKKIEIINEAKITENLLGKVHFDKCPICFKEIHSENITVCPLCKTPHEEQKQLSKQYLHIITDIEFQIKESTINIEHNLKILNKIIHRIDLLTKNIEDEKREQYKYLIHSDSSKAEIINKSEKVGYLRRLVEDNIQKIDMLKKLNIIIAQRDENKTNYLKIELEIKNIEQKREDREYKVYESIYNISKEILKKDLNFETEFQSPDEVFIDFYKDYYSLNGRKKFSDSSMVLLRTALRFAIFYNSILDKKMRFPRFFIIDNIEDKGMQEIRSWNFQRTIIDSCSSLDKNTYQIIYSTSMLPSELNDSEYLLRKYYIKGEHTLNI